VTAKKASELVAALDGATGTQLGSHVYKIDAYYGDQPDVIDAVIRARQRGNSYAALGRILTNPEKGVIIRAGAVKSWLESRNIP
jgi:hypothetical protein